MASPQSGEDLELEAPPEPLVREDPRVVLARAMRTGDQVAIHVALASGGSLRACGVVRALDDRHVEIVELSGRTRRLPLSRVVEARAIPPRRAVESRPGSGAEE